MKRNLKIEGIIVRNYRIQDYHKGTVIYSPDAGIIHAVAFGGYKGKSRLGPSVQPLTRGVFEIYHDPVKNSNKIAEYEPHNMYEEIKKDLKKYFTAVTWLEIALKAHGGGEGCTDLYKLLSLSLDYLEKLSAVFDDRIMIQFLLRCINILGGSMATNECGICGRETADSDLLFYNDAGSCFACSDCSAAGMSQVSAGIRKYIEYSLNNDFMPSLNAGMEINLLKYLKSLLYSIIQQYLENNLSTLQTGKDCLI
jgi:DNA repair protein RecO